MRAIATASLTLEPQIAAHADEMFGVLGDPAIDEHENAPPPSLAWLRERFARLESRRSADGREQWLDQRAEGMLAELARRYGVRRFTAVLKRANLRSQRLLERLGFTPGWPAAEPDELLMQRDLG